MAIFDVVRNAMLAGFGVQEKVREFIDELVKKGELSESQGAKLIREWTEKAEKNTDDISRNLAEVIKKPLEKMNLPTREDFEKLNEKVNALTLRIKKLEGIREEGS